MNQPTPAAGLAAAAPSITPKTTVRVRLVWPAERGAKEDCRANTGIVWTGHGDVQDFPAVLWHKLSPHPDVWQLATEADAALVSAAHLQFNESAQQRAARINAETARMAAATADLAEQQRLAAASAAAAAAAVGTDHVTATPATDLTPAGTGQPGPGASNAQQADEFDKPPLQGTPEAEPLRAVAGQASTFLSNRKPDEPAAAREYTQADLDAMDDSDIHAEGGRRGYVLHPRLTPVNLRAKFLQLQAER